MDDEYYSGLPGGMHELNDRFRKLEARIVKLRHDIYKMVSDEAQNNFDRNLDAVLEGAKICRPNHE